MRFHFLTIILLLSPLLLWADGYHNSTKRFTDPKEMKESDWSDPSELERVWKAALVRIPVGPSKVVKTPMSKLKSEMIPKEKKYPTVIYLHGCSGVWKGTYTRIDFLAKNGFAVIAPVSFARLKYPQSCDIKSHRGGMYRPTLKMRQNDAGFAIKMAKTLPWVDSNNVFLMGLSQGGITTATFRSDDPVLSVNARVIEGWTCHAGWKEYQGINAPQSEPVLSLVGEKDPWFQRPYSIGDCGEFLSVDNGSKSIVYKSGRLKSRHELLEFADVQKAVLSFLTEHLQE